MQFTSVRASQATSTQQLTEIEARIQSIQEEFENIKASRAAQNKLTEHAQDLNKKCLECCEQMSGTNKLVLDHIITTQRTLNHWKNWFTALASVTIVSLFANIVLGCCLNHHHNKADSTQDATPAGSQAALILPQESLS